MSNSKYQHGRQAEHRAIQALTKQGYECMRAAGSKGAWDILAWKDNMPVRHIQVKSEGRLTNKLYRQECRVLALAPCSRNGRRELWVWSRPVGIWRLILVIDDPEEPTILHQVQIPTGRKAKMTTEERRRAMDSAMRNSRFP